MEMSRVVAIVLAMLAAVLVIVAAKACADDARNHSTMNNHSERSTIGNPSPGGYVVYDEADTTVPQETETEKMYEEITNMLGEVIETIPVTSDEDAVVQAATTETKSLLEAYEERNATEPEKEAPTQEHVAPATNIVVHIG